MKTRAIIAAASLVAVAGLAAQMTVYAGSRAGTECLRATPTADSNVDPRVGTVNAKTAGEMLSAIHPLRYSARIDEIRKAFGNPTVESGTKNDAGRWDAMWYYWFPGERPVLVAFSPDGVFVDAWQVDDMPSQSGQVSETP